MQLEPKKHIVIMLIIWSIILAASLSWNLKQSSQSTEAEHLKTAKAFVRQIIITRIWNAKSGGVYLPVSDTLQPNPFLQVPNKDIETTSGLQLTMVNPAFMTRLISDIAKEKGHIQFHLTSLKPINPGNTPTTWEKSALQKFEKTDSKEDLLYHQNNNIDLFSYMSPLITRESCLKCHKQQGYQTGDIRGGISVTFPVKKKSTRPLILSHLLLLMAGVVLILIFGRKIIFLTEVLKKQSNVDGLTQIANRKHFDETLHREWLRSRRLKTSLSLIMCDIDHFKLYNDTYGHPKGDKCLKQVAQALNCTAKRPADMTARYGGEEFIILLPETSRGGALLFAELLQNAIEKLAIPHTASETASHITISLGAATMSSQLIPEKDLIESADMALYASKNDGRNIFTHADDI